MRLLYNLSIRFYVLAIHIAALLNPKAKSWVKGRKHIFNKLGKAINSSSDLAWFHVSSLGEFEQGLPVMEAFKKQYPNYKILLTFFSPSGYEIRKNYKGADYIFYLPYDSKRNARLFLQIANPKVVFFVKYEYWFHYLNQLKKQNIPTYIFSAIFRKNQLFFKAYGKWYRKILASFTKIYVQNTESEQLLKTIGVTHVEVGGDTRFDRVYALAKGAKPIKLIEKFAEGNRVIVAGSTWEPDEKIIAEFAQKTKLRMKWIIAPHEVHESHIKNIISLFNTPVLKFSEANEQNICDTHILIIDNIGILSSLYRYGAIAYIGGGFGKGIHNTLEAATYGLPVVFGPLYSKFKEACDLIEIKSGFSIDSYETFEAIFTLLLKDDVLRKNTGENASKYVNKMCGGTEKILSNLSL